VIASVLTDASKLKQILINLVGNALKFTPKGTVTVRVEVEPATHRPRCIAVVDTGIGIPAERREAIFEHFQQADNSTARQYGGTGLGLAISRALCQLLGYQLTVESTVGQGSTFRIIMPV
jgi:signal transduction histidine kinase